MTRTVSTSAEEHPRSRLLFLLHLMVLAASVFLIVYITYDTVRNVSFVSNPRYLEVQFWICVLFVAEIVVEFFLSRRKLHYALTNLPFLLICIPWISVIHHYGLRVSGEAEYLLRFLPMLRAAFVLAVVWGFMQKNWISSMFGAYIILLVSTLYFLSLMFFVEEHAVNAEVASYWDSLWYSVMQMTTCGSDINPVTPTGKVLGVVLSAEGLVLFPVFTIYITDAFGKTRSDAQAE